MRAVILSTLNDKLEGVKGLDHLDEDEVYIFKNVSQHTGFHMQGVKFPIDIAFLDANYAILDVQQLEPEIGTTTAPSGTILAVEAQKDYFVNNELKPGVFWKEIFNRLETPLY